MPRVGRITFPSLLYRIRDREEQEIREKTARGLIGAEKFQEKIEMRVMEVRRPKRGRPGK